ncbi:MAG TPA: hypothetical protein VFY78_02815, partial [Gammaproteobacteria bacterium]|nr:hypothetical protein [Gammaproteobacteria bacterium]
MADASSGQSADQWKKKYYDQLDQLEQKESEWGKLESLLKRTIGRLSLAAEGHHQSLDQHIRDVRETVRETVNTRRLESILEKLSANLAKIEEKSKAPPRQIISVLQLLTDTLELPASCRKEQEKLAKKLAKADDDSHEMLTREWLALIKSALQSQSPSQNEVVTEKEKKPGL